MAPKREEIVGHLNAAIKGGDASALAPALGDAVRAFGMNALHDSTGYTRQKISRATDAKAKPRFETVHNIVRGMNLAIRFVPTKNDQEDEFGLCAGKSEDAYR